MHQRAATAAAAETNKHRHSDSDRRWLCAGDEELSVGGSSGGRHEGVGDMSSGGGGDKGSRGGEPPLPRSALVVSAAGAVLAMGWGALVLWRAGSNFYQWVAGDAGTSAAAAVKVEHQQEAATPQDSLYYNQYRNSTPFPPPKPRL